MKEVSCDMSDVKMQIDIAIDQHKYRDAVEGYYELAMINLTKDRYEMALNALTTADAIVKRNHLEHLACYEKLKYKVENHEELWRVC